MTWLLVAQILSAAPPLAPAQAAAIMARVDSPANVTNRFACLDCDGPRFVILPSSPTAGPFGEFPPLPRLRPLNCCSVYVTRLPRRGAHVRKGISHHRAAEPRRFLDFRNGGDQAQALSVVAGARNANDRTFQIRVKIPPRAIVRRRAA